MTRPDGLVDPTSPSEVAEVVGTVLAALGVAGLGDLLARLPGTRTDPATARRLFTPARPAAVHLGAEDLLVLGEPAEHQQVVGGVVLHRTTPTRGALPGLVAALVVRLVAAEASYDESAVVLSAAREAGQRW